MKHIYPTIVLLLFLPEFISAQGTAINSTASSLNLVDKNNYKLRELVLVDSKAACNSLYIQESGGVFTSEEVYSSDGTSKTAYQFRIKAGWKAKAQSESIFKGGGVYIYIQSFVYTVSILKNGEEVFSTNMIIQNFNFNLVRAFMQGQERSVSDAKIKEYTSENNNFSYGGVVFNTVIKFYDGTMVWEPNTRIGQAYETYMVRIKIILE